MATKSLFVVCASVLAIAQVGAEECVSLTEPTECLLEGRIFTRAVDTSRFLVAVDLRDEKGVADGDVDHLFLFAQNLPLVLVGHSRGGVVISQAAEAMPEKVGTLVYLCAFLLRDGESLLKAAESDLNGTSLLLPNLVPDEDRGSLTVRGEALKDAFYGDCSEAQADLG